MTTVLRKYRAIFEINLPEHKASA